MLKYVFVFLLVLMLSGCGAQETFETVSDLDAAPVYATDNHISFSLPDDAAVESMEAEDGSKIYLCNGYTLTVHKLASGDLDRTLREITGFGRDALTVMETVKNGFKCYRCVWSAAGEGEDQVGRATILDDGQSHHVIAVMADSAQAGDLIGAWEHIMASATLVNTD